MRLLGEVLEGLDEAAVECFSSYLTGNRQVVWIHHVFLEWLNTTYGVPLET